MSKLNSTEIVNTYRSVQESICTFLVEVTGQSFFEEEWSYDKGKGGGRTRVWEGTLDSNHVIEKGGVNFSAIEGNQLPTASNMNLPDDVEFLATGVSIVIHPFNPHVPTIHMNIRYFETNHGTWWFGGGIDVTPYYPQRTQVIEFHKALQKLCTQHKHDYDLYKKQCDEYFYLPHRKEARGVGGIFFDHLGSNSGHTAVGLLNFTRDLGLLFISIYRKFLLNATLTYTSAQREFQLIRRGRYVEFNLLWDRGTKFGIQSEGRTESILMSLPANVIWRYNYTPPEGTDEHQLLDFFLKPQDWANMEIPL